jgi:hypothetical protein
MTGEAFGRLGPVAQQEGDSRRIWFPYEAESDKGLSGDLHAGLSPVSEKEVITISAESGGFWFREEGRDVLFYQRDAVQKGQIQRSNYVHPLFALDGELLSQSFPEDHRHHQGIFWAWHQLWVDGKMIGDPWLAKDFLVDVIDTRIVDEGPLFATLKISAHWTSPLIVSENGEPRPIVREETSIRLFRQMSAVQLIDFTIRLTPLLPDVRLGGAENERGYSGFTLRVKPPEDLVIQDDDGTLTQDRIGGQSAWASVAGHFENGKDTASVAILSHSSLPEFPPRWLLRHDGLQNVLYPGREPVQLSADNPLVLRHRLVVHRGGGKEARIAEHQRAYESLPLE